MNTENPSILNYQSLLLSQNSEQYFNKCCYVQSKPPENGKLYHRTTFNYLKGILARMELVADKVIKNPYRPISFTSDWRQHCSNMVWKDNLPTSLEVLIEVEWNAMFLPAVYEVEFVHQIEMTNQFGYKLIELPEANHLVTIYTPYHVIKNIMFLDENEYFLCKPSFLLRGNAEIYLRKDKLKKAQRSVLYSQWQGFKDLRELT